MGLPGMMINAVQCIYSDVQWCVRVDGIRREFFNVSSGLKQGCILSTVLFNLILNDLIIELSATSWCGVIIGEE